MAFKKVGPQSAVPDSPDKLFLSLPRRKLPGLLIHQGEVLRNYASLAVASKDVALQLPTGSGKTLVGLLIAEWRRRKFGDRVVFLCPTRQLVNQVVEQANDQYGLSVLGFTGPAAKYDPTARSEYRGADRVAVTTYSSLFNTNPFFHDADTIIVDDAHAAENYIAGTWSLSVERANEKHAVLHQALARALYPMIGPAAHARLSGQWNGPADANWVDKLPTPSFATVMDSLRTIIDEHVDNAADLRFAWSLLRDNLFACHLYLSSNDILLRPLIPPTWTHNAFDRPKQRIYMSATLGAGGDLERLFGRKKVQRLPVPEGWNQQGIGRRFFLFPEMSLDAEKAKLNRPGF